jgi:hypothetical protein
MLTETHDKSYSPEFEKITKKLGLHDNSIRVLIKYEAIPSSIIPHNHYNSSACRSILIACNWSLCREYFENMIVFIFTNERKTSNGNIVEFEDYINSIDFESISDHGSVALQLNELSPCPLTSVIFVPFAKTWKIFPLSTISRIYPPSKSSRLELVSSRTVNDRSSVIINNVALQNDYVTFDTFEEPEEEILFDDLYHQSLSDDDET